MSRCCQGAHPTSPAPRALRRSKRPDWVTKWGNEQAWHATDCQPIVSRRSIRDCRDYQTRENARKCGRGGGIRTPDPLLPKQMRYQAALRPDFMIIPQRVMYPAADAAACVLGLSVLVSSVYGSSPDFARHCRLSHERRKLHRGTTERWHASGDRESALRLWYRQPAANWNEALPIGNGRLGAMVFGGVEQERLQLNEDTVWAGEKRDRLNPGGTGGRRGSAPASVRRKGRRGRGARRQGDHRHAAAHAALPAARRSAAQFPTADPRPAIGASWISPAPIARVTFAIDGTTYTREVFSSAVDQAIVVRLTKTGPGKIGFTATLSREMSAAVAVGRPRPHRDGRAGAARSQVGRARRTSARPASASRRRCRRCPGRPGPHRRRRARGRRRRRRDAGPHRGDGDQDEGPAGRSRRRRRPRRRGEAVRQGARGSRRRLPEIVQSRLADLPPKGGSYGEWRGGRLGRSRRKREGQDSADRRAPEGRDRRWSRIPELIALYFQFGRYLLISSSRPGTMAANLQGIWNDSLSPLVGQQVHDQHQHPDELLAGGDHEPLRAPRAAVRPGRQRQARRTPRREGAVRRRRLRAAPQHGSLGRRRADRPGRLRHVADGRRLAQPPLLGPLRLHARRDVPARARAIRR